MGCTSSKADKTKKDADGSKAVDDDKADDTEPNTSVTEKPLSKERKQRLDELFSLWDLDRSGMIDIKEFEEQHRHVKMGPRESKVFGHLRDMDVNSDNQISKKEWDYWMAQTCQGLSDDDFEAIFSEIIGVAERSVAVVNAMRAANDGFDTPAILYDENGNEVSLETALPEKRRKRVMELFSAWDWNNQGFIDSAKLKKLALKMGPFSLQVISLMSEMDKDHDSHVTADEMLEYFQITCGNLTDGEFDQVITDLLDTAQKATAIIQATAIAEGKSTDLMAQEAMTQESEMPTAELSESRKEKLEELFKAWAGNKGYIDLAALKDKKLHIGAQEVMLFAQFAEMDENHDNKVSKDELFEYFRMVGSYVSDCEFQAVVDDMIGVANTSDTIKNLLAQLAMMDQEDVVM